MPVFLFLFFFGGGGGQSFSESLADPSVDPTTYVTSDLMAVCPFQRDLYTHVVCILSITRGSNQIT